MGIYYHLSTVSTLERLQLQVKFGDVAGCDGAKTELVEVVDFLKNASRWPTVNLDISLLFRDH